VTPALWLDAGVAAGGLLALLLLLNGGRHLRRRRYARGSVHGLGGLVVGFAAAIALLIGINLLTYARFNAEEPVGEIGFVGVGPQRYDVTLARPDGHTVDAELTGDEWEVDARIIKWKGLGTLLGLPPLYRLERLSGRYQSIAQARRERESVVALSRPRGLSLWDIAHRQARWLPLVDASYGTATYLPMADGAQYEISLSPTGLLARPANAAARKAVAGWE